MREYFTLSVRTWKMKKFTVIKFLDRNGYLKLSRGERCNCCLLVGIVYSPMWEPTLRRKLFPQSFTLTMESICSIWTLVTTHPTTRYDSPEEPNISIKTIKNATLSSGLEVTIGWLKFSILLSHLAFSEIIC